jgi:hypothetical protein
MSAAALLRRTREAIDELRQIRCTDRAAEDALETVRLTIHTLEHWWLPELERLAAQALK